MRVTTASAVTRSTRANRVTTGTRSEVIAVLKQMQSNYKAGHMGDTKFYGSTGVHTCTHARMCMHVQAHAVFDAADGHATVVKVI